MSREGDDTPNVDGAPVIADAPITPGVAVPPPGEAGSSPAEVPAEVPVPADGRNSRWPAVLGILGLIVGIAAIAAAFVPLPYRIISPGDATPVSDVVEIHGTKTYAHRGEFLFLTVSVSNRDPSVYRFLTAKLDGDSQIVGRDEILGHGSQRENNQINRRLMDESEVTAKKVALERLGYNVPVHGEGALVAQLMKDAAVRGQIRAGDVITEADGHPITVADELGPIVRRHRPGEPVKLVVRAGTPRTVTVTTGENAQHQAFLGVAVFTKNLKYDFPVDVQIDPGPVSGPSAGLSFTLTIIDELTKGNLAGGKQVAITGTIEPDGTVGEVGGVAQKAVTARRAGAVLMIVPTSEVAEARRHAGSSMKVVGVKTLEDALRALRAVGGAAVPPAAELRKAA